MHYRSNRKGYTCGTYNKKGVDYCTSHLIREDSLYKAVLDDLNNLLQPLDTSYTVKSIKSMLQNRVKQLKKQCTTQNNYKKVKRGYIAFKMMEYTVEYNLTRRNNTLYQFATTKPLLESKLSSTELLLQHLSSPDTLSILLKSVTNQYVTTLTPSILNTFISKIEIGEDDTLYIHYNFFTPKYI